MVLCRALALEMPVQPPHLQEELMDAAIYAEKELRVMGEVRALVGAWRDRASDCDAMSLGGIREAWVGRAKTYRLAADGLEAVIGEVK